MSSWLARARARWFGCVEIPREDYYGLKLILWDKLTCLVQE